MLPKQMNFGNIVIMIKINSLLKVRRLCAARVDLQYFKNWNLEQELLKFK